MSLQQYAGNGRVVIASGAKQSTSGGFAFFLAPRTLGLGAIPWEPFNVTLTSRSIGETFADDTFERTVGVLRIVYAMPCSAAIGANMRYRRELSALPP